jgi:hypothetical protein
MQVLFGPQVSWPVAPPGLQPLGPAAAPVQQGWPAVPQATQVFEALHIVGPVPEGVHPPPAQQVPPGCPQDVVVLEQMLDALQV